MFVEFKIGNFRSFRDQEKFTMVASPLRTNDSGLEEQNVFEVKNLRLLKSKAIYGGNASGKSNLTKAIGAFALMVSRSVSQEGIAKQIWEDRFQLITDWDEQPIFFQYIFLLSNTLYRYGFQILNEKVSQEWLFGQHNENQEVEYFMRDSKTLKINDEHFVGSEVYLNQALSGDNELFRTDSLFLTGAALNGNKLAASLRNHIRTIMTVDGVNDDDAIQFAIRHLAKGSDEQKEALKRLMSAADTGVEDLELLEIQDTNVKKMLSGESKDSSNDASKKRPQVLFSSHSRYDENGEFKDRISVPFGEWESEGTGKLFGIGALVLESLRRGQTLVIDEFDARFHPNLTLKIVYLFHSEKTNPRNAQLIFVTHDTGLLRRAGLRRDQICLIDKDKFGISSLRTLIEFKGIRKDASYEKEYLNGSYSAVPFLDEVDWILSQNSNLKDGL